MSEMRYNMHDISSDFNEIKPNLLEILPDFMFLIVASAIPDTSFMFLCIKCLFLSTTVMFMQKNSCQEGAFLK